MPNSVSLNKSIYSKTYHKGKNLFKDTLCLD